MGRGGVCWFPGGRPGRVNREGPRGGRHGGWLQAEGSAGFKAGEVVPSVCGDLWCAVVRRETGIDEGSSQSIPVAGGEGPQEGCA